MKYSYHTVVTCNKEAYDIVSNKMVKFRYWYIKIVDSEKSKKELRIKCFFNTATVYPLLYLISFPAIFFSVLNSGYIILCLL